MIKPTKTGLISLILKGISIVFIGVFLTACNEPPTNSDSLEESPLSKAFAAQNARNQKEDAESEAAARESDERKLAAQLASNERTEAIKAQTASTTQSLRDATTRANGEFDVRKEQVRADGQIGAARANANGQLMQTGLGGLMNYVGTTNAAKTAAEGQKEAAALRLEETKARFGSDETKAADRASRERAEERRAETEVLLARINAAKTQEEAAAIAREGELKRKIRAEVADLNAQAVNEAQDATLLKNYSQDKEIAVGTSVGGDPVTQEDINRVENHMVNQGWATRDSVGKVTVLADSEIRSAIGRSGNLIGAASSLSKSAAETLAQIPDASPEEALNLRNDANGLITQHDLLLNQANPSINNANEIMCKSANLSEMSACLMGLGGDSSYDLLSKFEILGTNVTDFLRVSRDANENDTKSLQAVHTARNTVIKSLDDLRSEFSKGSIAEQKFNNLDNAMKLLMIKKMADKDYDKFSTSENIEGEVADLLDDAGSITELYTLAAQNGFGGLTNESIPLELWRNEITPNLRRSGS